MDIRTYPSFTEAYVGLSRLLVEHPDYVSSPRGMQVREKLGVQFRISNPRDRLPFVRARDFSLSYLVAEMTWYLSGNDSTKWISRYAPFWRGISDDGVTANSAYGSRIFRQHPRIGQIVQWKYVIDELRKDPESRRAVIHIRVPADSDTASKDVPCTLSLHFFLREGKLHLHVSMRSSDIVLGLAYDVPAFTVMQEMMANELDVELGEYVHTSNSLHCYSRDEETLRAMAEWDPPSLGAMRPVPKAFPIAALVAVEGSVSDMSLDDVLVPIKSLSSDDLVNDWGLILLANRMRKAKRHEMVKACRDAFVWRPYAFFTR